MWTNKKNKKRKENKKTEILNGAFKEKERFF